MKYVTPTYLMEALAESNKPVTFRHFPTAPCYPACRAACAPTQPRLFSPHMPDAPPPPTPSCRAACCPRVCAAHSALCLALPPLITYSSPTAGLPACQHCHCGLAPHVCCSHVLFANDIHRLVATAPRCLAPDAAPRLLVGHNTWFTFVKLAGYDVP